MLQIISVICTCLLVCTNSFSLNNTAQLVSTYAKVAHWGAAGPSYSPNEGRSSGQTLWTHRSDVNIRGGQNLKRKQPITYYYSMGTPSSKIDQIKSEPIPSKGEVQERFNPRPYFDFTFDDSPRPYRRPAPSSNPKEADGKPSLPSIVYGTPVDLFPTIDRPPVLAQPSESNTKPIADAYNSPFNSYNPSNAKPDDSKNNAAGSFDFPPNNAELYESPDDNQPPSLPKPTYGTPGKPVGPVAPADVSYAMPPKDIYGPLLDDSKPKPDPIESHKSPTGDYSFHPPLAPPLPEESMPAKQPDNSYLAPPPPESGGNSYYVPPPSNDDHPPDYKPGYQAHHLPPSADYGPPISQTIEPPGPAVPPYLDHSPPNQDYHYASAVPSEDDLSPPPSAVPYGKIPQYLDHPPNNHDFYNFGHHDVYHEVHHTTSTTTEAPRASHYSYYYLGRKLWYIPLYFSVYFIVYVTLLIWKSIARHKIQFSHNFDKGRDSRALDFVNQTVANAIESVERKYM